MHKIFTTPVFRYRRICVSALLLVIVAAIATAMATSSSEPTSPLERGYIWLLVIGGSFAVAYIVPAILSRSNAITKTRLDTLCIVAFWLLVAGVCIGINQFTADLSNHNHDPFVVVAPASMALGVLVALFPRASNEPGNSNDGN